jgi:hypothetical protein
MTGVAPVLSVPHYGKLRAPTILFRLLLSLGCDVSRRG